MHIKFKVYQTYSIPLEVVREALDILEDKKPNNYYPIMLFLSTKYQFEPSPLRQIANEIFNYWRYSRGAKGRYPVSVQTWTETDDAMSLQDTIRLKLEAPKQEE